ncbi:hybrid signal transduction histidine kinase M [Tanacetum coccineum]
MVVEGFDVVVVYGKTPVVDARSEVVVVEVGNPVASYPCLKHGNCEVVSFLVEVLELLHSLFDAKAKGLSVDLCLPVDSCFATVLFESITNLTTLIPIKLDMDEMNYSSWVYFFQNHCKGFEVLEHILGKPTDEATSSDPSPPISDWLKIDSIEAWDILAEIFGDNRRSRSITMKAELRSLKLGDLSIDAYFRKIESVATILAGLGSHISNNDIVNIALDRLPDYYGGDAVEVEGSSY